VTHKKNKSWAKQTVEQNSKDGEQEGDGKKKKRKTLSKKKRMKMKKALEEFYTRKSEVTKIVDKDETLRYLGDIGTTKNALATLYLPSLKQSAEAAKKSFMFAPMAGGARTATQGEDIVDILSSQVDDQEDETEHEVGSLAGSFLRHSISKC